MTSPPGNSGDEIEMPDFSNMSPEEMMAWLESLAKRQGASPEELTTSADLDIPEPPPDVVIDEPGYTEYDPKLGRPKTKEEVEAERAAAAAAEAPPTPPEMEPAATPAASVEEPTAPPEPVAESPQPEEAELGLTPEMLQDPVAWLETLAKRQGVREEELATPANLEIPEPPPDAVIDEPGYTEYDPKLGRPKTKEEMEAERAAAEAQVAEAPPSPPEAAITDESTRPVPPPEPVAEAPREEEKPAPGAGLPSWLSQPVPAQEPEPEPELPPIDELPPAEPTALPRWLAEAQQEAAPEVEAPAFEEAPEAESLGLPEGIGEEAPVEELPPAEPGELPDWLRERMPEEVAPAAEQEPALPPEAIEDSWIEAFEFEEQMKSATAAPAETAQVAEAPQEPAPAEAPVAPGAEETPEWLSSIGEEAPAAQQEETPEWLQIISPAEEAPQPEAATEDMSWLDTIVEESEAEEPLEDWMVQALKEQEAEEPEVPLPTGGPTAEAAPPAVEEVTAPPEEAPAAEPQISPHLAEEAAEWVREMVEAPLTPAEELVEAPAEATAEVSVEEDAEAPAPEPQLIAEQEEHLEAEPGDYRARLELARRLVSDGEKDAGLGEYERLIDASELLEEVAADLEELISQHPDDPHALRLLGDAYMRLDRLQDALDAYQSALDHL